VNAVRPILRVARARCVLLLGKAAAFVARQAWLRSEPLSAASGGLHAGLVSRERADR